MCLHALCMCGFFDQSPILSPSSDKSTNCMSCVLSLLCKQVISQLLRSTLKRDNKSPYLSYSFLSFPGQGSQGILKTQPGVPLFHPLLLYLFPSFILVPDVCSFTVCTSLVLVSFLSYLFHDQYTSCLYCFSHQYHS